MGNETTLTVNNEDYVIKTNFFYLNEILLYILVFSLIITPMDSLNLKLTSFTCLILMNLKIIISFLLKHKYFLFFTIFYPLLLIINSVLITEEVLISLKNIYFFGYLLIIPIIRIHSIKYDKIVYQVLYLLAIIICISGLLDIFNVLPLARNKLIQFFQENHEGTIGFYHTATFRYIIFLKGSPLLIILVGYSVVQKNFLKYAICLLAMAFTGTRANLYSSILISLVIYFFNTRVTPLKIVVISFCVSIFIYFSESIISYLTLIQDAKVFFDSQKINHVRSIYLLIRENPIYFFSGSGLGSYFYSLGANKLVNLTELSFFEVFRQVGLIGFIPFIVFLFVPINSLWKTKNYRWKIITYIGYLIIAFTNPVLFSSTPFVLYVLIYVDYLYITNNTTGIKNQTKKSLT